MPVTTRIRKNDSVAMPMAIVVEKRRVRTCVRVACRCKKTFENTACERLRSLTGAPERTSESLNDVGTARRLRQKTSSPVAFMFFLSRPRR